MDQLHLSRSSRHIQTSAPVASIGTINQLDALHTTLTFTNTQNI